jgi:hypothetical protein
MDFLTHLFFVKVPLLSLSLQRCKCSSLKAVSLQIEIHHSRLNSSNPTSGNFIGSSRRDAEATLAALPVWQC